MERVMAWAVRACLTSCLLGTLVASQPATAQEATQAQAAAPTPELPGTATAQPLAAVPPEAGPLATQPSDRVAGPFILVDVPTGEVLKEHDALRPWYPASITKLMTTYVAFRAVAAGELTLESPVTVTARSAAEPPSKMGFKPGTMLTLDDALKIMMVKSANDIATAVAETVGGSREAFAARMNEESRRLGMDRSNWVNAHGLHDPGQVTTARDMAVLARALLQEFPQHRRFFSVHAIQFGKGILRNYNALIGRYPGANGMKTGYICASGYNLVASAQRGPREAIAVVLGEYDEDDRAEHAAALLNEAFQATAPAPTPAPTLATVRSGEAYRTAIDMRPFVCPARNSVKVAEPAAAEQRGIVTSSMTGTIQPVSLLGPPVDLGPPVQISLIPSTGRLKPGKPGFVARLPRPRPELH